VGNGGGGAIVEDKLMVVKTWISQASGTYYGLKFILPYINSNTAGCRRIGNNHQKPKMRNKLDTQNSGTNQT